MHAESSQIVAATRLFSSGVLTKLAKSGNVREFTALCIAAGIPLSSDTGNTVGEAFDAAFNLLKVKGLRSEYVYKAALTHNVLLGIHSLATASLVSEFRVGASKADVVIFNGTSTVYEIKSERDNLSRLEGQISDYRKFFANVYVICAPIHARSVEKMLPDDVGILTLSRWNRISTIRNAKDRASEICPDTVFSSLTNSEAKSILKMCGAHIPIVPNTRLRKELQREFRDLDSSTLHRAVVKTLKKTRSTESLKSVLHNLPKSVMPAVMNLRLRQVDRERLIEVMKKPLSTL
jgi:hypothetical protein